MSHHGGVLRVERLNIVQSPRLLILCCLTRQHQHQRRWCSGNINAFQAFALGSIPGRRMLIYSLTGKSFRVF